MSENPVQIALVVAAFRAETALETVDLALAFGLLDLPISVYLERAAQPHLWPQTQDLLGRWRTLLDYCPAQVFYCVDQSSLSVPLETQRWQFPAEVLSLEQYAAHLARADRVVLG